MFPEDCEINVEDLVRYMKGLWTSCWNYWHNGESNEIQVTMHILKDSYLLQPCGKIIM
jgi:hypothetical protein